MDFTLKKYRQLCTTVLEKHKPATVLDYINGNQNNVAVFRHDVDRKPLNALEMAKVEHSIGIKSTYYFRTVPDVFKPEIMKEIHDMGHEIGFHYEVLDKTTGDYDKAIKLFQKEIKEFPYEIKTICMHGNPLTKWDNRDMWKKYDMKNYGVAGEAYLSINFDNILYFTDTGRAWNGKYAIKDFVTVKNPHTSKLKGTDSLIYLLKKEDLGSICLLTHPDRWTDSYPGYLKQLIYQSIKNNFKTLIKWYRK